MTFLPRLKSPWTLLGLALAAIYIRGLFINLMDVDASQYAALSMEMLQNGHWLQVLYRHADYLDKPPMLFWTSATSFALFGLHDWSYKLPSLLVVIAGIYATFRFALLYYTRDVARNAAFIFASCVGAVLMSNDVRTDAMLTGFTACSIWQIAEFDLSRRMKHLLIAACFIACAMMTKGPLGLVIPGFAVGTHLILRRDWRALFDWRWVMMLAIVAVLLLPMCWGLYQQFDLHPGKMINGSPVTSGLKFYFWDQSFGRITGSNVWKNNTTLFTFFHVYLWVFLPWSLLFIGALWQRARLVVVARLQLQRTQEGYSLGAFALTFVALSLSHYKLPHYIFVTLPWASIITASALDALSRNKGWWRAQWLVFAVLAGVVGWLLVGVFPPGALLVWVCALLLFGWLLVRCIGSKSEPNGNALAERTVQAAVATLFLVNFHFYPHLLPFQSTIAVPKFIAAEQINPARIAYFNRWGPAFDFYMGRVVPEYLTTEAVMQAARRGSVIVYTDKGGRARLDSAGVMYNEVQRFEHFEVAQLTGHFLNHRTRSNALTPIYLLFIRGQP